MREKAAIYWKENSAKNKDKKVQKDEIINEDIEEESKSSEDDVLDDVKVKLQSAIANMSPKKFEQFSRVLLTKMGSSSQIREYKFQMMVVLTAMGIIQTMMISEQLVL